MISVSCDNIKLSFGAEDILCGVSFALNDGERLGIVGVNGAGKSSLLKIITGQYDATDGGVYISKDKTVGMLSQNAVLESSLTVYEEMLSAYDDLIKTEKSSTCWDIVVYYILIPSSMILRQHNPLLVSL